jgi:lipopolysaccharide transport system ATP-binding protein
MSDLAISVDGLSKSYRIARVQGKRYSTLQEDIVRLPRRAMDALRRNSMVSKSRLETFWALKNVSFEAREGDVIGIIGRNGAGKSTLLKILSRITEPTAGGADLYGRVGTLLEVGTGFHPELTGRENIYLSGAILGMRRTEITARFDEIVEFAEMAAFIDTPVKRYSSGMYMKLAFSVAAHLDPEILIVDEVLAVGDAVFQKKCIGKMGDVARTGRTVLFVSHNMAAVEALCKTGIWLERGVVRAMGPIQEVVNAYMQPALQTEVSQSDQFPAWNDDVGIGLLDCKAEVIVRDTTNLRITVDIGAREVLHRIGIGLTVYAQNGALISWLAPKMTNFMIERLEGVHRCVFECDDIGRYLSGGEYAIGVWAARPKIEDLVRVELATVVTIPPRDVYGSGQYFEARPWGLVPLALSFCESNVGSLR